MHKENSDSFDLSGDVYDVIFENENRELQAPFAEQDGGWHGATPNTIIISDLLKHVKASNCKFYKPNTNNRPSGSLQEKLTPEKLSFYACLNTLF